MSGGSTNKRLGTQTNNEIIVQRSLQWNKILHILFPLNIHRPQSLGYSICLWWQVSCEWTRWNLPITHVEIGQIELVFCVSWNAVKLCLRNNCYQNDYLDIGFANEFAKQKRVKELLLLSHQKIQAETIKTQTCSYLVPFGFSSLRLHLMIHRVVRNQQQLISWRSDSTVLIKCNVIKPRRVLLSPLISGTRKSGKFRQLAKFTIIRLLILRLYRPYLSRQQKSHCILCEIWLPVTLLSFIRISFSQRDFSKTAVLKGPQARGNSVEE